jgi:hypothetical protein
LFFHADGPKLPSGCWPSRKSRCRKRVALVENGAIDVPNVQRVQIAIVLALSDRNIDIRRTTPDSSGLIKGAFIHWK